MSFLNFVGCHKCGDHHHNCCGISTNLVGTGLFERSKKDGPSYSILFIWLLQVSDINRCCPRGLNCPDQLDQYNWYTSSMVYLLAVTMSVGPSVHPSPTSFKECFKLFSQQPLNGFWWKLKLRLTGPISTATTHFSNNLGDLLQTPKTMHLINIQMAAKSNISTFLCIWIS
jgi:hypothetical protein